jgi:hypothetical protein
MLSAASAKLKVAGIAAAIPFGPDPPELGAPNAESASFVLAPQPDSSMNATDHAATPTTGRRISMGTTKARSFL